jgi:SAM-dependent methyltransferase
MSPRLSADRALLALQRGLTGERALAGTPYMDDPALVKAYADYYLEVSRAQILRIVSLAGVHARAVLDMGAGPGSVSLAMAGAGARTFTLVDTSEAALGLARTALDAFARGEGVQMSVSTVKATLESPLAVPPGAFDLVAFGHCLNEIGSGGDRVRRRLGIVRDSAKYLAPGGVVLVMEPATLAASRDALALRDALAAEGWKIMAPCTRMGSCPALAAGANHTCHDEAGWEVPPAVRKLADAAGLDRELIKMTWFIAAPPGGVLTGSKALGAEAPRGEAPGGEALYRVVSAPMLNKGGRVRYLVCGPEGRFPFSARKDDEHARRAGFFALERYDLLRIQDPGQREGGWGFVQGTRIERIRVMANTGHLAPGQPARED